MYKKDIAWLLSGHGDAKILDKIQIHSRAQYHKAQNSLGTLWAAVGVH